MKTHTEEAEKASKKIATKEDKKRLKVMLTFGKVDPFLASCVTHVLANARVNCPWIKSLKPRGS